MHLGYAGRVNERLTCCLLLRLLEPMDGNAACGSEMIQILGKKQATLGEAGTIVTCSSDNTIRTWRAPADEYAVPLSYH